MKGSAYLRILAFVIIGFLLLHWSGSTGDSSAFVEQPWLWAVLGIITLIYIAGEICIAALRNVLYRTLTPEARIRYDEEVISAKENQFSGIKRVYKKLLGENRPMAAEGEILLDHDYDGIRELDNNLPPWWVYGFYATIVFAVVYLVRYHVFDDANQHEEYAIAVAEATLEIEEYKRTAKNLIDVNTVEFLSEASDISAGKAVFTENCIACHKADGGGGIGPNLTDDYWILGGGIKNIFNTISEGGRAGKGMVSWKTDLKPAEMAQVASYVMTLQGTTPAEPKAPEGEIWVDENAAVNAVKVEAIDSTKVEVILQEESSDVALEDQTE